MNELRSYAVKNVSASNATIIGNLVSTVDSEAVKGEMPNINLMRQRITYARAAAGPSLPVNPLRREDLEIPEFLKTTFRGERFVHYDSGVGDVNRIIVFATAKNLELLKMSPEWFVDGTFKVCPLIFHQLYTFHVRLPDGKTVPVVYSLLPAKNAQTYRRLLQILLDAIDGFHPDAIHIDFELAMIRELEKVFPAAGILGCSFHFCQCIWRRVQNDSELRANYLRDADFALDLRMFPALSYVLVDQVRDLFATLTDSDFVRTNEALLTDFINYFESQWVGWNRNPPTMKVEWWNVHSSTLNSMGRTNNEVEGWHSAFARRVGSSHPSVFKLLEHLKVEQGKVEFIASNSLAQGIGTTSKKKYRDRQARIYALVSTYEARDSLQFLRAIAHNITF
ncbi:uncharacterized protein LOC108863783 [Galendromus occidentalis]|uniref:Uncharacterized protein LOC108863783 n=1 Tax=Galendromus occidentalis TaxID=34638 RepID=A0AAJ7P9L0_9ACAR|nr:uncharacterized protein LOC108863783 [Galendromus occidentalis]